MLSEDSSLLVAMNLASSGLRNPQREALEAFATALDHAEILQLTGFAAEYFSERLATRAGWTRTPKDLAEADMALATGVGKSRLAGAIIELLALSARSKTFIVLTHRDLLRRRWRELLTPDSSLCVIPQLAKAEDHLRIGSFSAQVGSVGPDQVLIVIQTVQALNSSKQNWSKATWVSPDLAEMIRERDDLVVVFDESHHLAVSAAERGWRPAVMALNPKLLIGLTATPHEGRQVVYEYSLRRLLTEQLYSKSLAFSVVADVPDDSELLESLALETGCQLLARKRKSLAHLPEDHILRVRGWRPVMMVAAPSVDDASAAVDRLINDFGFQRDQILLITSRHKTDRAIEKVLALDDPAHAGIEVVVAAFMLDEGWDVTSVSVIVPLRSLNSVGNAKQIIGRGLRLPLGQRSGTQELDRLDVVIVGQKTLLEIKQEVKDEFGSAVGVVGANGAPGPVATNVSGSTGSFECTLARSASVTPFFIPILTPSTVNRPRDYPTELSTSGAVLIDAVSGTVRDLKLKTNESEMRIACSAITAKAPYLTDTEIQDFLSAVRPADWAVSVASLRKAMKEYLGECSSEWVAVKTTRQLLSELLVCGSKRDPSVPLSAGSGWQGSDHWYNGWSKSVYDLAQFDNEREFEAATVLDGASSVAWWLRNDPAVLSVTTPSQRRGHEPDFLAYTGLGVLLRVEIKGEGYWVEHQSSVMPSLAKWADCLADAGYPAQYSMIPAEDVTSSLVPILDSSSTAPSST